MKPRWNRSAKRVLSRPPCVTLLPKPELLWAALITTSRPRKLLCWLYQMGLILFWLYDRSENQQRTQKLMEKSLGLLVTLLRLSGLPLMKPVRKTALEMVETFAP